MTSEPLIGFTCAYTPLALLDAAGFVPYRLMPLTEAPDQAGTLLHDNTCPHVKRVLDRAMHRDLPKMAGLVLMNSCDAMRRLADGWLATRPESAIGAERLASSLARRSPIVTAMAASWSLRSGTPNGRQQLR